jgi:hypothetical protein
MLILDNRHIVWIFYNSMRDIWNNVLEKLTILIFTLFEKINRFILTSFKINDSRFYVL